MSAAVPVVAAAVAAGAVTPATAGAIVSPRTMCTSDGPNFYWKASSPQQAWVPAGSYLEGSRTFTKGESVSVTGSTSESELKSYTLGTQIGASGGIDIGVFDDKVSANVSANTTWANTVSVTVGSTQSYPEPMNENARPLAFVQGYRIKATVYTLHTLNTGPVRCKFLPSKTQYVYLYHKSPATEVGWVGVGVTPHAVVAPWKKATVLNP